MQIQLNKNFYNNSQCNSIHQYYNSITQFIYPLSLSLNLIDKYIPITLTFSISQYVERLIPQRQRMQHFTQPIEEYHIPEIVTLIAQLIVTMHTSYNLHRNRDEFPVKQLSPLLSFTALLCFFIVNCISFTAKLIQTGNSYYDFDYQSLQNCGQCRLYNHPQMIILSLPLIIFIVKTYRVCLCYSIDYSKQLSDRLKWMFSSQRRLLILCVLITIVIMIVGYVVFDSGDNQHYGLLWFQFFCPKQSSLYQWLLTTLSFTCMAYVYTISIFTYSELDFKRFLLLIFIVNNTQVLLRLFLALGNITQTTYHEFYYHSLVMNLLGTLIMLYYSTMKEQRNRPLTLPILDNFKAFLQSALGFSVLEYYAQQLGNNQQTIQGKIIFQSYISIVEINIKSYYTNYDISQEHLRKLIEILSCEQIQQVIDNSGLLLERCKRRLIGGVELRQMQLRLEEYCERHIFNQWKQTQSTKYLQTEFKNNGVINLRMNDLQIGLK